MSLAHSLLTRREMLRIGTAGFGSMALSALLSRDLVAANVVNPLQPRPPHFGPRARSVIFLFMDGGPSQMDTFDPKPRLNADDGKAMPMQVKTQNVNTGKVLRSPFSFAQHGGSGAWVSELFPHVAKCVDDICFIRSMYHDQINHANGCYLMHTGAFLPGRPSMGAWVTYGLGSESENLPGFVVINCGSIPSGGTQNFSNGFLPAVYQGTLFKPLRHPLPDVQPLEKDPAQQIRKIALTRQLDAHSLATLGNEDAIEAAMRNYELAFRMQAAVPEIGNLDGESEATRKLYGVGEKSTDSFGRGCLLARRLVEKGVRFVQVTTPETGFRRWDQHNRLKEGLEANAAATDQPVAALLQDLKSRGMLNDTLVLWGGEFGRTPSSEAIGLGRDHNPHGFTMWMAGGGIKSGLSYGQTDEFGYAAIENKVHVHDLHATILHQLGFDHERLTYRFGGRDFRLTDVKGEVVKDILA